MAFPTELKERGKKKTGRDVCVFHSSIACTCRNYEKKKKVKEMATDEKCWTC